MIMQDMDTSVDHEFSIKVDPFFYLEIIRFLDSLLGKTIVSFFFVYRKIA